MTTYLVTTTNWNDPAFWFGISETGPGAILDFSTLPSNFTVNFDAWNGTFILSDGSSSYSIGEPGDTGTDANLGGTSQFSYFTTVSGTANNDTIAGGANADTLQGNAGDDHISGGDGDDSLSGGSGRDTLLGGAGDDTLSGGAGNDSLRGGDGSDTFILLNSFGRDTIIGDFGGSNNDTIDLRGVTETVTITFDGPGRGMIVQGSNTAVFFGIEQFLIFDETVSSGTTGDVWEIKTDADDDFPGDGTGKTYFTGGGSDTLNGEGGDDVIYAGAGNDSVSGGIGDDTIFGGAGNDNIGGGEGQDWISGGTGNDGIGAGAGDDTIFGDAGDDGIGGGDGNDWISGGTGNDGIGGDAGNDTIFGDAGDDGIGGGEGNDVISGGTGNDGIGGDAGDDTIFGDDGDDSLDGGEGFDWISGGSGNDAISGDLGDDTIYGNDGNDTIAGESGHDVVDGGAGNDLVFGDDGDDTLQGGAGNDELHGQAGNDMLSGGSGNDTLQGGEGNDTLLETDTPEPLVLLLFGDSNSTAVDASGNGHDGIYQGGATAGGTGWRGDEDGTKGAVLDGADDYIEIPNDPAFSLTSGTVSLRFNAASVGGTQTLISRDHQSFGDGGHFRVSVTDTGAFEVRLQSTTENYTISSDPGTVIAGNWQHVAVTFGPNGLELYVDGVLEAGEDFAGGIAGNTQPWILGADQRSSTEGTTDDLSHFFQGQIDEFALFDLQMSPHQVATLHSEGAASSGDDTLYGGAGEDRLEGGAGDDQLSGGDGADTLAGGTGDDTLTGGAGNDLLDGGAGNDQLSGGDGSDTLAGGDDADTFVYRDGFGIDTVIGGEGGTDFDTIDLLGVTSGVSIDWTGAEAGTITNGSNVITFSEIEHIITTDASDIVNASFESSAINVYGAQGDDTLIGGSGDDRLFGGDGNDLIRGGAGNDSIAGGAGDDVLHGGAGADTIDGGTGYDVLDYRTSDAAIHVDLSDANSESGGDAEGDVLSNISQVDGSLLNDTITASNDGMLIKGLAGDDLLTGGAGDDNLQGDDGNDTLAGGAGRDTLSGGEGNDALQGGGGDDTITTGSGKDRIVLSGDGGADTVTDFDLDDSDADGFFADQIDVSGLVNADGSAVRAKDVQVSDDGNGNALLTFPGGETLVLQGVTPEQLTGSGRLQAAGIPCYTSGTRIDTPCGSKRVEDLRAGDLVMTSDHGPQPLIWCGRSDISSDALRRASNLNPVLLHARALGNPKPILVSAQHCFLVKDDRGQETLVRARHLARTPCARTLEYQREISYIHIMCVQHEIITADGIKSETFYPGPQALKMLDLESLLQILALFPGLSLLEPEKFYGERARPVLSYRKVEQIFSRSPKRRLHERHEIAAPF